MGPAIVNPNKLRNADARMQMTETLYLRAVFFPMPPPLGLSTEAESSPLTPFENSVFLSGVIKRLVALDVVASEGVHVGAAFCAIAGFLLKFFDSVL
jgi:hypothetical protein